MIDRKLQDASRLALQSAVAAAGQFLLMKFLGLPEAFVGVLSAVLVVQPTVGHTLGQSLDRIVSTLIGSALGLLSLFVLPSGHGTAVALAVCMLGVNFLAGYYPHWRYGVVAAVALALGSGDDVLQTALDRAIAIGSGALLGTVITLIVWPDRAGARASRSLREALAAIADRLDSAIENARTVEERETDSARRRYHSAMERARNAADGIRVGDQDSVKKRIERVERLYNSVLILNRVAEETDSATDGNERLGEAVETIRCCACELTRMMAEDRNEPGDRMDRIWSSIDRAREASARTEDRDDRDHVLRNGLVFGLGEVADSLEALLDEESKD